MSVEIHLAGVATTELAGPVQALLRAVGDSEPDERVLSRNEALYRGDPVALAALVLAIPGAILATMDLVQRAGVAQKITDLLKQACKTGGDVTLRVNDEAPLDLKTATVDEVLDLLGKT